MHVYRGLPLPRKTGKRERYDFDALRHGDAIEVQSVAGCREVFRRWKKRTGSKAQLVRSMEPGQERLLFFVNGPTFANADVV